ncbi:MAG: response regulator [Lachnospiraceae bacterium]|nr:response regulator [Lachnospiraceae bacterium]
MDKIVLIGRSVGTFNEIHSFLSTHFDVTVCPDSSPSLGALVRSVNPDIIIVHLIPGAVEKYTAICWEIFSDFKKIPVITIGTEAERVNFDVFYYDNQFENLAKPVESRKLLEACERRINAATGRNAFSINSENNASSVSSAANNASTSAASVDTGAVLSGTPFASAEIGGKKKILVVDDDPIMLRNVKTILDRQYEVMLAVSGTKALASIAKKRPDLIFLDYEMPVCNGKQTLEMIRADEDIKDIPVVFLTGVSDATHIKAVLALKPSGYMLKPVNKDDLLKKAEAVIGK